MNPSSFPAGPPPVPGSASASASAAAAAAAAALHGVPPTRALLSSLPSSLAYTSAPPLPASISPHLALQHNLEAMAAVRAQQQQHQLAAMHSQLMASYPAVPSAPQMAALEALYGAGRKLPPPGLGPGELAVLHREQLQLHLEESRRERERLERREQDRLEQERRDKERKEMIERCVPVCSHFNQYILTLPNLFNDSITIVMFIFL